MFISCEQCAAIAEERKRREQENQAKVKVEFSIYIAHNVIHLFPAEIEKLKGKRVKVTIEEI